MKQEQEQGEKVLKFLVKHWKLIIQIIVIVIICVLASL